MSFIARLQRAREILEQQGRLSTRALERELGIGGDELDELIEELVDVQQVARREGRILVWNAPATTPPAATPGVAGTSGAAPTTQEAVARKVVTVVFADLIGSTSLHERLDAESARGLMDRYYGALRAAVEVHGGRVVKLLGDGVMAAFGVPRVAEDDAIRAVRAAAGMQQAFREQIAGGVPTGGIGLRVAVNTGEVVVSADNSDVVGDPVNVAARLQQEAQDGEVLLGEATQRLVRELITLAPVGAFSLKGRAEPVRAFRVVSLDRPPGVAATAFVGRDEELARVTAVYDAAVAAPAARLVVVLGSPGLGKSRLLHEFARRLGDGATVLTARCDAAGGATFAPLAEALRAYLHVDGVGRADALRAAIDAVVPGPEVDRVRIASGIGGLLAGTPAAPEETFFVVRRFLGALAATRPVVLALDDLQWAEPLLLDLVEHLVQWGTGVRLLVLAAARPDLRDLRSSLAQPGGLVSDVVTLAGLDAAAATRLAANVIGAEVLPAAVTGRVLATSEGNPLFVGELVRMLVNDGALRQEGDRWTTAVELASLEMPPTIHALLAARIERLGAEERTVLERAAVIGRQFSRAAVAHLLPAELRAQLDARLEALRRSELIEPDTTWFLGEPALRFHHGLTRDAAYRRVLRGTRAELHTRVADWIVGRVGEGIEHDETIGWHLEQAHQHLRELGPLDAQGRALGARAVRYLGAAGRRALGRDDLPVAANLLGRALGLLEVEDPRRAELALDWCEALLAAGDVGPAAEAIGELGRFLETSGGDRLRAWHACFAGELAALTDPQALRATADAVAAAAQTLASLGDAAGEAKAHSVHALALGRLGRVGACEAALDLALTAARRAGDRRRSNTVLAGAPLAALWGPSPVTRASGRCLDVVRVLRITQGAPAVEATALRCQAVLEALRGRAEAARRMIASSRRMVEELGLTQGLLETEYFAGLIELIEGNDAAAERTLRAAYDGLRAHGLGIDAARAAALLGRPLLAQGRVAEAEALSHESEALAGDDLQAAITWRRVRAEALARRGEHAAAVDVARAAVEIAAATDGLLYHADARLALAAALRAAGRPADAATEEARAIELWETKGAAVLVERGRAAFGRVGRVRRAADARAAAARPARRRVGANAATAHAARLDAAIAARDADALTSVLAGEGEGLDHATSATTDSVGYLRSFRYLLRAEDPRCRHEPLATLGDSLALFRQSTSATGFAGATVDVGAYERDDIHLIEVAALGRYRDEIFAVDRLGDAVARLYERYAELLPDGHARDRAAATARSVASLLGPADHWAFAPDVEAIDHRTVGFGRVVGADAVVRVTRALLELIADPVTHFESILGLRSDALLVGFTQSGTDRIGGGVFERRLCRLLVFGADGLVTRWEQYDAEREGEALARFDELTSEPSPAGFPARTATTSARRVQPNAATANAARFEAAIAARDADAISAHVAAAGEVLDHSTGTVYDREASLYPWFVFLKSEDGRYGVEPLATLGDSLAVFRQWMSGSGMSYKKVDVGASEMEHLLLIEVDGQARRRWTEIFRPDRLGDAVARLYVRFADGFPDGPARTRAAATARAVAALPLVGPPDLDRYFAALSPDLAFADRRIAGIGSAQGADAYVGWVRSLYEVAADIATRTDDVLALRSDALLVRSINSGTERVGGGAFERHLLMLWVFGADGRVTRLEQFDLEGEAQALARFDQLTSESSPTRLRPPVRAATNPARRVRPNAATAAAAQAAAALAAHDVDSFLACLADDWQIIDHPTGTAYDRRGLGTTWRRALRGVPDLKFQCEAIATLGDALGLFRDWVCGSASPGGTFDVGAFEMEHVYLNEVDGQGRCRHSERFALDRLGDAIVRLYGRYAELLPEGPERRRAAATARAIATQLGPLELERFVSAVAPAVEYVDHRRLIGAGLIHGAQAFREAFRALFEVADDMTNRVDDVLGLRADAGLLRVTNLGTERVGGGSYERPLLVISVWADGLIARVEAFDVDREAEALARFDELTAERVPARSVHRRVRPNAATANAARIDAAVAARDADALSALFADAAEFVEHPTGAVYDREGVLKSLRSFLGARDPVLRQEPLAALGDALALCRVSWSASGLAGGRFDVGAYETERFDVIEVDAQGRRRRHEAFALDRLGDAIVRLYERYAEVLPDGPVRARAAATTRSVAAYVGPWDIARLAAAFAPGIEAVDHRSLGTWIARGADALLQHFRSFLALVEGATLRADDVLALRADGYLVRWMNFGTDRAGGGAFERPFLAITLFGADGLTTRMEPFDVDREAEALARFNELGPRGADGPAASPAARIENAATQMMWSRVREIWLARDWEAWAALFAPGFRCFDRRKQIQLELDRNQYLESYRPMFEMRSSVPSYEVLATRGRRLAIVRVGWEGADDLVGPSEMEWLAVIEVDDAGRRVAMVNFDADALDAAYAELDERYGTGEAARYAGGWREILRFWRAMAARDWREMAATFAPGFVLEDRRPIGVLGSLSADEYVASVRALLDLRPDATLRLAHILAFDDRRVLSVGRWAGGEQEGTFEIPVVNVVDFGPGGARRWHFYNLDQLDAAWACYETLAARVPALRIENAATRNLDRFKQAWEVRDWGRVTATLAAGFRTMDRRRMLRLDFGRVEQLESLRFLFDMRSSRVTGQVLATRGDRLALTRMRFEGSDDDGGASEIEALFVLEVDHHGDAIALVVLDVDDLDAAYAELDRCYFVGEGAPYADAFQGRIQPAVAARDWEALASMFAPDFVIEDHRRGGLLKSLSRDEWVASVRSLHDLRPDTALRLDHILALDDRRSLTIGGWVGGEPDGSFDIPFVVLTSYGPEGIRRWYAYSVDQLDEARARFDALGEGGRAGDAARDPLAALAKPNAATAAMDRVQAAFAARDWAALRALCAADMKVDDRRGPTPVTRDAEGWIAELQEIARARPDARLERQLVGMAGDRVDVERIRVTGGIAYLWLTEIDERGHLTGATAFAFDDWRAAAAETAARVLAVDEAAAMLRPNYELMLRFNDHDLAGMRAALADDVIVHDHRRAGMGLVKGADAYLESLAALWRLTPDIGIDMGFELARGRHGLVTAVRDVGTLPEGGTFERPMVTVAIVAGGRVTQYEFFELEDVDAALARFAELRPDPLRIPPNAATRASDRFWDCRERRDWEALRALCAPIVWEDRRRLIRTTGDCDTVIANWKLISRAGTRVSRTVLAAPGDRLMLQRVRFTGDSERHIFEADVLDVIEVDGQGRIVALVNFDPDDRRAASAELLDRYARSDEARLIPPEVFEAQRALNAHDLDRLRAALPVDYVYEDRRRTGIGRLESAEAYVASVVPLFELTPDAILEVLYTLATEKHGQLAMAHGFGTLADGGEFESVYVVLSRYQGGRFVGVEMFEPDDLDVARARFEALRADPLRIPPNAATRAGDRWAQYIETQDWAALAALFAPTLVFEDRRRLIRTTGDRDMAIANAREIASMRARPLRMLLVTLGDCLALWRVRFVGGDAGSEYEIDALQLGEVDAEGRFVAGIAFDPDDRRAASAELLERYARSDAARDIPAAFFEGLGAYNAHDLTRIRTAMSDPFVVDDHRRTGIGRLESVDDHVAAAAALFELAPGAMQELLYVIAAEKHGILTMAHGFGTLADGGEFEVVFVVLASFQGDRVVGLELFEPEHLDAARARLEALRPPQADEVPRCPPESRKTATSG